MEVFQTHQQLPADNRDLRFGEDPRLELDIVSK
jgi:hypothetical protein